MWDFIKANIILSHIFNLILFNFYLILFLFNLIKYYLSLFLEIAIIMSSPTQ